MTKEKRSLKRGHVASSRARAMRAHYLLQFSFFAVTSVTHAAKRKGINLENRSQQTRKKGEAIIPNRSLDHYSTTRKMKSLGGFQLKNTNNNLTH